MFKIIKKYSCGIIHLGIPNFQDHRGLFSKIYKSDDFLKLGISFNPKEHFHSFSNKNVLRGMHFQINKDAHSKLINCIQGSILDVCVDVRKESAYFNQPICVELHEKSFSALFIPKGFAHGFIANQDNTLVQYMTDTTHQPENDKGVLWSSINFNWPIKSPITSERDSSHPSIGENEWIFY